MKRFLREKEKELKTTFQPFPLPGESSTTVDLKWLNYRVRNGIGCFPLQYERGQDF